MKSAFTDLLAEKILLLDGATGTMLQASGMPAGVAPEKFCLENPSVLANIHREYIRAGADILTTCTFGANAFKLWQGADVEDVNRRLAQVARACVDECGGSGSLLVAGNAGPTGFFAKPLGDVEPRDLIAAFEEQIKGLAAGGADLIFIETQFDLAEARAAVMAARRVCDLPVMVSMTFETGRSLTGSTPEIFAETMQNLGCAAIGSNCSLGPVEMKPVIEKLLAVSSCAIMAEPNAGLPLLVDGRTVFPLDPEEFADKTVVFAEMGARILGGCCGTTPAHIAALKKRLAAVKAPERVFPAWHGVTLTSRSDLLRLGDGCPLAIIGERINPTGKPDLAAQLVAGDFTLALRMAEEQAAMGASALDVNVGAPRVDEAALLPRLVSALVETTSLPLALDSSSVKAIEAALPYWPGSCLVNSISGEKGRLQELGPLCRDAGSPFILLPLAGAQLPVTAAERIAITGNLLSEIESLGIPKRLILIDVLALAVSASSDAARECLYMARWCAERGYATTIGLSNISFGLPARPLLNAVFLAMARGAGISSCIANPGIAILRQTADALGALEGGQAGMDKFMAAYRGWKAGEASAAAAKPEQTARTLYECVLYGDRENIINRLEKDLAEGKRPFELVNEVLIPAITEVGEKYAKKEFFLPQLIRSAETMKAAFARLAPLLREAGGKGEKPTIVLATVEGDIHDIGKNIVSLLLGNHGFEVIDAGKDVPAEKIVDCAVRNNASIIGLSALMTTTMARMEDTIKLLKERSLPIKVIVGGAAVTQDFADAIGADRYCETAVDSVKAAKDFIAAV